ncbi:DNA methyltransferase [Empedobacter brevis]|uniref:DNA methyltransferase n=1 Tax=Empedobacter brevis TaxID=247 RepID=UPI0028D112C2|nr:DNA methyltransferase [Empedobacter brevis]
MSINITNEDNMELMARYPENYFDLAIVDPPYGIGESSKNFKSRNTPVKQKNEKILRCSNPIYVIKNWDFKPASVNYFNKLFSVSKNQIVYGANYFESIMKPCNVPRRKDFENFLKEHPFHFIIWDKVNGGNDFNDCELIWTSFPVKSYILKYMWAGMMQGVDFKGTMQGDKSKNEKRFHPTQKPVALYKWLLDKYAKPSDKILDTHLGSGSIAISCHDYDFDLTACELDKEYFDKAMERIKNHQKQQLLFQ